MGTIFYGVTGEGRGHATRVRTLVELLRAEHSLVIYAPGMAYDFLAPLYQNSDVTVRRIPGLDFHYDARGEVSYTRTGLHAARFLARLPSRVKAISEDMLREKPDLVITDFEPLLPRAAKRCGIPYISVNHQHFLRVSDLKALPMHLRFHARFMGSLVGLYYNKQETSVVSSFYNPPLRKGLKNVTNIGVLLRPEVLNARVSHGNHLVVYLRRFMAENVEQALASCGRQVHIYGLGERPSKGNLHFRPICPTGFVEDLASSAALVSTAGNQLLGEALYMEKPCLVFPEKGNREQEINAWFLEDSNGGIAIPMDQFSSLTMARFLNEMESYRESIDASFLNGNDGALAAIHAQLGQTKNVPIHAEASLAWQKVV